MSILKNRFLLIIVGLLGVLGFVIITLAVRADILRQLDFDFIVRLQNNIPQRAYAPLAFFTQLARFEVIVPVTFLLLFFIKKKLSVFALFMLGIAHILEVIGKMILTQPPPPFQFFKAPTDLWFPPNYVISGNSYPSGHSMRATFLATLLCIWALQSSVSSWKKWIIILSSIIFAGLSSVAKVALGQHWITDVIAGVVLGFGMAILTYIPFLKTTTSKK